MVKSYKASIWLEACSVFQVSPPSSQQEADRHATGAAAEFYILTHSCCGLLKPQTHPSDTSPPKRPHLSDKGHTFKNTSLLGPFPSKSVWKDTFLIATRNRIWGSGIEAEILGNIVSYLLTWPSLSLSSHMVMFWASHLWVMLRNTERHKSHELPPVCD